MSRLLPVFLMILLSANCSNAVAEDLSLRRSSAKQQILVLNNGNVERGILTPRPGGFDVALNPGRMFVADSQVRFQAVSMEDAYYKMRASVQELTPEIHVELSRWCTKNQLLSFAKKELLDALFLHPDHTTARLMLERMTRNENRKQQASQSDDVDRAKRMTEHVAARSVLPERRSLGGLPQSLAVTFTRRIQPVLSNKCARCHSHDRNSFNVVSVRNGSSAVMTEQNLASVLNQIDFDDPPNSPLLSATLGLHGGSRQLLFSGPSGRSQVSQLRQWITAVAGEIGPRADAAQKTSHHSPAGIVQTAAAMDMTPVNVGSEAGLLIATHSTSRDKTRSAEKQTLEAVIATRHDEFDPDVFNRRFHGQTSSFVPPSQ